RVLPGADRQGAVQRGGAHRRAREVPRRPHLGGVGVLVPEQGGRDGKVSPLGLLQERVARDRHYPWRVLVVCALLNRTHRRQVRPMFEELFERAPTPEAMLGADLSDLLRPLGPVEAESRDPAAPDLRLPVRLRAGEPRGRPVRGRLLGDLRGGPDRRQAGRPHAQTLHDLEQEMAKKKWTKAEREEHSARIKAALSRRRSSVAPVPGELLALGDGRDAVGLDFGKLELRAGARFAEDALRASSVEQLLDALVEHGGTLAAV